jgi:predicted nuclease of predicted toxin-antitoxin system
VKFHLDEHVSHAVARALRSRGIDVTTATDAGLLSADDDAHIEFARSTNRVVFTNDADFLRFAHQVHEHSGIVYCAPNTRTIGDVVRFLSLIHELLEADEMNGKVEYL